MAKGKLIVIDGTDGSGKTMQTAMLMERFTKDGLPFKTTSFPTYGKDSCKAVSLYLNGDFGSAEYTGPFFGSMLYAFNRWKETGPMAEDLNNGINYILNRYFTANVGHQGGKIKDPAERQRFIGWLQELEFGIFKIPKPNEIIFLHMPSVVGQQFLVGKSEEERKYLTDGKKKDIHEADLGHLMAARDAYLDGVKTFGWKEVKCARPELSDVVLNDATISPLFKVRAPEDIHEEIYAIARKCLGLIPPQ